MKIMCVNCTSPCTDDLENGLSADEILDREEIQRRVEAGMTWLDEHVPDHVGRFDPDRFDIMNEDHPGDPYSHRRACVLIQAMQARDWGDAKDKSGLTHEQTLDFGFLPPYDCPLSELKVFNEIWLEAYAEREAALID